MAISSGSANNHTTGDEGSEDKLEEVYTLNDDAVQLLNDGRTFQTIKLGSFHCAIGKNLYSSGIHHIRLKVHSGHAFFGIRSRNIKPVPDFAGTTLMYVKSPSTYGWFTNSGRIVNGYFDHHNLNLFYRENAVFELTLNCDERRLKMVINENTMEQDEMEISKLDVPFPWCLFVQLNRVGAQISLLKMSS